MKTTTSHNLYDLTADDNWMDIVPYLSIAEAEALFANNVPDTGDAAFTEHELLLVYRRVAAELTQTTRTTLNLEDIVKDPVSDFPGVDVDAVKHEARQALERMRSEAVQ